MYVSRYMPCDRCGQSLDRADPAPHECAPERFADFQMFGMRAEIEGFPSRFRAFMRTPHGQFEAWLAARHVRQSH